MPSKLEEILLSVGIGYLDAVVQPKLVDLLKQLEILEDQEDEKNFELDIQGSYRLFSRIAILAAKTKTKFDDTAVNLILHSLRDAAANAEPVIELPE